MKDDKRAELKESAKMTKEQIKELRRLQQQEEEYEEGFIDDIEPAL